MKTFVTPNMKANPAAQESIILGGRGGPIGAGTQRNTRQIPNMLHKASLGIRLGQGIRLAPGIRFGPGRNRDTILSKSNTKIKQ